MTSGSFNPSSNNHGRSRLFRAVTITPVASSPIRWVDRSSAIHSSISYSQDGANPCITGPIGSGKTTIALQYMQSRAQSFQYVSARPLVGVPQEWIHPGNDFGDAWAELFNYLTSRTDTFEAGAIEELLGTITSQYDIEPHNFVFDDLEMLSREQLKHMYSPLQQHFGNIPLTDGVFITRAIDGQTLELLQEVGEIRMVLPRVLEFNAEETRQAQQLGVFGDASIEQALEARDVSHGWITGMLAHLEGFGGETLSHEAFEDLILNDLLLRHTDAFFHTLCLLAELPAIYERMIDRILDYFALPLILSNVLVTQIPHYRPNRNSDQIVVVPAVKDVILKYGRHSANDAIMREIRVIALKWYLGNDMFEEASIFARQKQLQQEYVSLLAEKAKTMAIREQFAPLDAALADIPDHLILAEPELAYWYTLGLGQNRNWIRSKSWNRVLIDAWSTSSNTTTRARSHLVRSWDHRILQQFDEMLEHAATAYELLPESATVDRMWAAELASMAESQRGNQASAREWTLHRNAENARLPYTSMVAEITYTMENFSWLAIRGLIEESYEELQNLKLDHDDYGDLLLRIRVLLAHFDIERLRLDSAETLLQRAAADSNSGQHHQHPLRVANSALARARGDLQSAYNHLVAPGPRRKLRVDQFARESYQKARAAIELGDVDAAEMFMAASPLPKRPSIRHFGDAHPELVLARIDFARGNTDLAIETARKVFQRAVEDQHTQVAVNAQAELAWMYAQAGDSTLLQFAVDQAIQTAGNHDFQFSFFVNGVDVRELVDSPAKLIGSAPTHATVHLTEREIEVLTLVSRRKSNQEVANQLFVSLSTVKNHLSSIYDKLNTNNRRSAVNIARQHNLLDIDPDAHS